MFDLAKDRAGLAVSNIPAKIFPRNVIFTKCLTDGLTHGQTVGHPASNMIEIEERI